MTTNNLFFSIGIPLILLGKLGETLTKIVKPSWSLMVRCSRPTEYKKSPNVQYDNLKSRPDEVIIDEKLTSMINPDGTLKNEAYDPTKPLPRISPTDTTGCNHMAVCKNIEDITGKPEYLVIGNVSSSGVAYIENKHGAIVGVRHIAELFNTHTPNGEKVMQYFWALRIPAIAQKSDLHELVGETQMLSENPHMLEHLDKHYAYWRKRGILSEYYKPTNIKNINNEISEKEL